jgi:hypothetical protein
MVTIEGCEYRVSKEAIIGFLSSYGEVVSDVLEVVVSDVNAGGDIRLGSYRVQIKLNKDLPQLAPIMGKRVSFYYRGIQKLCPNCFGPHPKRVCQSRKVPWISYVASFIAREKGIPVDYYGKWIEILQKTDRPASRRSDPEVVTKGDVPSTTNVLGPQEAGNDTLPNMENSQVSQDSQTAAWINNLPQTTEPNTEGKNGAPGKNVSLPTEDDFNLPQNDDEYQTMVSRLVGAGSNPNEAEQIIANRRIAYNKACREYKKLHPGKLAKGSQKKSNKISKPVCLNPIKYGD